MKRVSKITGRPFHPETLAMGYDYDPFLSEGAAKPPVFLTSTFCFRNAQEGKEFFELAYGLKEKREGQDLGLIYSRLNNPNLEILEKRLAAWEGAEKAATFAAGLAAISTTVMALVKPGDSIITTNPVYGGTDYFFEHILDHWGVKVYRVNAGSRAPEEMAGILDRDPRVRIIYLETPANPNLILTDIRALADLAAAHSTEERRILTIVDNTLLGPLFQRPIEHGADVVIYSATKFIGGHSDLVAGVSIADEELMKSIMEYRTILGTMSSPFNTWLMSRSLETLAVRMERQQQNALEVFRVLQEHPAVAAVFYPGSNEDKRQQEIYQRQCTGSGSLISFEIKGGEKEAFQVLNRFEIFKLAVSLGGTESLVEHPKTMTHSDLDPETQKEAGITDALIRISLGIEHPEDLCADIRQALDVLL